MKSNPETSLPNWDDDLEKQQPLVTDKEKERTPDAFAATKPKTGNKDAMIEAIIQSALHDQEESEVNIKEKKTKEQNQEESKADIKEKISKERIDFLKNALSTNQLTEVLTGSLYTFHTEWQTAKDPTLAKKLKEVYQLAKNETLWYISTQLERKNIIPGYEAYLKSLATLLDHDNYSEIIRLEKDLLERRKEMETEMELSTVRVFLEDTSTDHIDLLLPRLDRAYQQYQIARLSKKTYEDMKAHLRELVKERAEEAILNDERKKWEDLNNRISINNFVSKKEDGERRAA
jgi:hypothetical protein